VKGCGGKKKENRGQPYLELKKRTGEWQALVLMGNKIVPLHKILLTALFVRLGVVVRYKKRWHWGKKYGNRSYSNTYMLFSMERVNHLE